jgi:N-hydroxyarylamine O-acetyltransferase
MDIDAYLHRIGYAGPVAPTTSVLHALHQAHLLAVPFENLDIHLGHAITLDEAALFAKIVGKRRGGFCYELNGLFSALLREVGFVVTLLAARVAHEDGSCGPPFDHLALLVESGEPWLVDVGFGDCFLVPLRLDEVGEQVQGCDGYCIAADGDERTLLRRGNAPARDWAPQYRFTLQSHALVEFATMCHYHQTSPKSPFTRGRVCSRATPDGRITLRDGRLIVTTAGTRSEQALEDEEAQRAALWEHFSIVLEG